MSFRFNPLTGEFDIVKVSEVQVISPAGVVQSMSEYSDWEEEEDLMYFEVQHNLNTLEPSVHIFMDDEGLITPHKLQVTSNNAVRLYVTKNAKFTGRIFIKR